VTWLIYGANGYTGELVAREAVARGHSPILAGRHREKVGALAAELGLTARVFPLESPATVAAELYGVKAVLHCAGPFILTARPMVEACLGTGAHYLDITGEIGVFERVLAQTEAARRAGVVLLPGVGFDVVPTDCLAARLSAALPDATELTLAFFAERGEASRGTLLTMIESLPHAGAVRRDGKIVEVPIAFDAREIPFSCGPRWTMTIPWGDVSTAFHSTGIPNIRVYTGTPPGTIRRLKRIRPLVPLAGWGPVKRLARRWVERKVAGGPGAEARETSRVYLWGEVKNEKGRTVTATLETPEGYALTAVAAVRCMEKALAGEVAPGAWTPSRAFGADFVGTLPGVVVGAVSG
jgi:short subunit dehydrogenase-like uncharacterized protein